MGKCKFIVTGPMRSGTTFLSSILNGQDGVGCFEAYPWHLFKSSYQFREELECELANREADFIHLGLNLPSFHAAETTSDLVRLYNMHLVNQFGLSSLGFKRTMLSGSAIKDRINDGIKIIILRRDTEDILKSWVRKIEPNIELASYQLHCYYKSIAFYQNFIDNPNLVIVDYKRLLSEKEAVCHELSDFLGIPLDFGVPRYYSFNKNRIPFDNNSSYNYSDVKTNLFSHLEIRHTDQKIKEYARKIDDNSFYSVRYRFIEILKKVYYSNFFKNS